MEKEMKRIVKAARDQGWRVEETTRQHAKFYAPDGIHIVIAAGSSGGGRGYANLIAQLRQHGFEWKGR